MLTQKFTSKNFRKQLWMYTGSVKCYLNEKMYIVRMPNWGLNKLWFSHITE